MEDELIIGGCLHWSADGIRCGVCGEPAPEESKNDYGEVTREQLRSLGAAMSEAAGIISRTLVDLAERLKEFINEVMEKVVEIRKTLNRELLKEQKANLKHSKIKTILKRYSSKNIFRKIKQFVRRRI